MNFSDYVPQSAQHTLVYGAPKTGKTQLVGELARKHKILWFDLENGINTLLKLPVEAQKNIELIKIADSRTHPIAIETMLKVSTGNKTRICNDHGRVNCVACTKNNPQAFSEVCLNELAEGTIVVLDSATQLSNSAMAKICMNQTDDYQPTFHDYRYQGAVLDRIFSQFQVAAYHMIIISHEIMVKLQDESEKIVPVAGTSNFSRTFAKYFDHVIYCEIKAKHHKQGSSTTYSLNVLTGSRTDVLIEKADVSSLELIYSPQKKGGGVEEAKLSQSVK